MGLVKKPTGWMTNAPLVAKELAKKCYKSHDKHVRLEGGRAAKAAIYPEGLVVAILRGLMAQRGADAAAWPNSVRLAAANEQVQCNRTKDTHDEYTGETLDPKLVAEGMREELKYFKGKEVWQVVPRAQAQGKRIVGTRWVCCNKGDHKKPDVRCRLVCQEVKTYQSEEFYAATPPGETLKLILSFAAECESLQISLVDISRAYFNAWIGREVFVELPPQAGYDKGKVGLLRKCMYGTRDAAQGWEGTYREALEKLGFRRGKSNPCVFQHVVRNIKLTVHGDDFFSVASASDLDWFEVSLLKVFEGKVKGRLTKPGDEVRILNRLARRTVNGYEWEADQRHAEIMAQQLGLDQDSRPLTNPGRKLAGKELDAEQEELSAEQSTAYRATTARGNFLVADRPDIAFAVKELCRGMAKPSARDAEALKRLGRYLLGCPRVVVHFEWQHDPQELSVMTDSDWAGCVKTRRSTSGGVIMRGSHLIKQWSSTQATVALSSAEAELISIVKGAAEGMGVRSLLRDLGSECEVVLSADASAAIGICRRTGIGKLRHLDTRILWIQDKVKSAELVLRKVLGLENPADLMTKHLGADRIAGHMRRLACWPKAGRAEGALESVGTF
jgi:hypothetical protein